MKNQDSDQIPQRNYTIKKKLPRQEVIYNALVEWHQDTEIIKELKSQTNSALEDLRDIARAGRSIDNDKNSQNAEFQKLQQAFNKKITELNNNIENILTKDNKIESDKIHKIEQVKILNYSDLETEAYDYTDARGYLMDKAKDAPRQLSLNYELVTNPIISKDALDLLKEGQCYAWTMMNCWNERQKDINNSKENPTRNMYDVLNSLVKQYQSTSLMLNSLNKYEEYDNTKDINISREYKGEELDKELQMILNYVLAIQETGYSIKQLKDAAENEDKKHKETIIEYDKNLFNIGAARQDLRLVDPSNAEPMIRRIFNKNREDYPLANLDKLIHPGVLIDVITETKDKDGKRSGHAMSCYMDKNENILFYDPNKGEKLTFTDVKNLIAYLQKDHKAKYKTMEIFPDDKCQPQIYSVNSDVDLQKQIEKGYADVDFLLGVVNLDDGQLRTKIRRTKENLEDLIYAGVTDEIDETKEVIDNLEKLLKNRSFLQEKSQELRALCKQEVEQATKNWPEIEKKFQKDRTDAARSVAITREDAARRVAITKLLREGNLINKELPKEFKKLSKDLDDIKQNLQNQQNKIASNEKIQNPRSKSYSNSRVT
ncbi:MAG: hypothetical protein K9G11_01680 [Rickettsiaceae bacterium]|nr:hypothetical protein [Rickettsiaceae bacterium]